MYRKPLLLASVLIILALIVAACTEIGTPEDVSSATAKNADGYTDISVEQLTNLLPDKDFTLVNVHIPFAGNIPNTDISIPYNEIDQNLDQLPGKDDTIVLYCRSGSMSTEAAKTLAKLGYSNVMELDGGFNAWTGAGNELLDQ